MNLYHKTVQEFWKTVSQCLMAMNWAVNLFSSADLGPVPFRVVSWMKDPRSLKTLLHILLCEYKWLLPILCFVRHNDTGLCFPKPNQSQDSAPKKGARTLQAIAESVPVKWVHLRSLYFL